MKNKFITILSSLMLMLTFTSLKADMNIGLSVMVGNLDTSGSETEKVDLSGTADVNNKSFTETFYSGSPISIKEVSSWVANASFERNQTDLIAFNNENGKKIIF